MRNTFLDMHYLPFTNHNMDKQPTTNYSVFWIPEKKGSNYQMKQNILFFFSEIIRKQSDSNDWIKRHKIEAGTTTNQANQIEPLF